MSREEAVEGLRHMMTDDETSESTDTRAAQREAADLGSVALVQGTTARATILSDTEKATTTTEVTSSPPPVQGALLAAYHALPDPEKYSDVGDAMLTEAYYAPVLRHSEELGWLRYHDGRWDTEDGEKEAKRAVGIVLHNEAVGQVDRLGQRDGKDLFNHLHMAYNRIDRIVSALEWRPNINARASQFDSRHDVLNCANGVVNLRDGTRQSHTPTDYLTKQTPYNYHEEYVERLLADPAEAQAICPQWLQFLNDIYLGDGELVNWMQKVLGYWLTGQTSEQAFFILYGGGKNGKSTLLSVLDRLLGRGDDTHRGSNGASYAASVLPELFVRNSRATSNGNGATPELAKLDGIRLAWTEEPESSDRSMQVAGATVKRLTGGTPVTARKLYHEPYEFVPRFKPVLAVNHLPRITEDTDGMWRRIRAIPFKARFEGARRVKDMDKVLLRAEAEGMLAWLVAGAVRWYSKGLGSKEDLSDLPAAVRRETRTYRERDEAYFGFFQYRLTHTDDTRDVVALDAAYTAFMDWREQHAADIRESLRMDTPTNHWNDLKPLPAVSLRRFGEMADENNFRKERRNFGRVLVAARLVGEDEARMAQDTDEADGEPEHDAVDEQVGGGLEEAAPVAPEQPSEKGVEGAVSAVGNQKCPGECSLGEKVQGAALATLATPNTPTPVTPPALEPESPPEGEPDVAPAGCAHPAVARLTVGRERVLRCRDCGETLGPVDPAAFGTCAHPHAVVVRTGLPDAEGVAEARMECPDCLHEFDCAEPDHHRVGWDAQGCPTCDAAWVARQGPDLRAQRKAEIVAQREAEAERKAEEARRQAESEARLARAQAEREARARAQRDANAAWKQAIRDVSTAESWVIERMRYAERGLEAGKTPSEMALTVEDVARSAYWKATRGWMSEQTRDNPTPVVTDWVEAVYRLHGRGLLKAVAKPDGGKGYLLSTALSQLERAEVAASRALSGPSKPAKQEKPASDKQLDFLRSLGAPESELAGLSAVHASTLLDWYKDGRTAWMLAEEEVAARLLKRPAHLPPPVDMATPDLIDTLTRLGYEGDLATLTYREALDEIECLAAARSAQRKTRPAHPPVYDSSDGEDDGEGDAWNAWQAS